MAHQTGERTEKATARRRQRAKNQGQFAYSQELTSAITLAACALTAGYYLSSPAGFRSFFESMLQQATAGDNSALVRQAGLYFLYAAAPVFVTAVAAALAGNFLQGLPVFAPEKPLLSFQRLNPVQALSRLKNQLSWIQWLKLTVLMGVVSLVVWKTVAAWWRELVTLPAYSIEASSLVLRGLTIRFVAYITVAVGIMAVADFFIQRWRFEQSIKQTKGEVKEDRRAVEGNPQIKDKIRSLRRESGRRMLMRVKDADVIVTNPTQYAVALEYKSGKMAAPRVIAKGRNLVAKKIKALGQEHDIPTVENVPLHDVLYRSVDVEQEIPAELYQTVAEVLADVYKAGKRPR